MSGDTIFEWVIASPTDEAVTASNGVRVDVEQTITQLNDCHLVFICSRAGCQGTVRTKNVLISQDALTVRGGDRRHLHRHLCFSSQLAC